MDPQQVLEGEWGPVEAVELETVGLGMVVVETVESEE